MYYSITDISCSAGGYCAHNTAKSSESAGWPGRWSCHSKCTSHIDYGHGIADVKEESETDSAGHRRVPVSVFLPRVANRQEGPSSCQPPLDSCCSTTAEKLPIQDRSLRPYLVTAGGS